MGFLDDVKDLGNKALEKGKEAADTAKTKLQISDNESKIKKVLVEIATDILENHTDILEEKYPAKLLEIKQLQAKIEELKASLAK